MKFGKGGGGGKEGAPMSSTAVPDPRKFDLHGLSSVREDPIGSKVVMYASMFRGDLDQLRSELVLQYGQEPEEGSVQAEHKPAVWARVLNTWGLDPLEHPLDVPKDPQS
ncbi:hypothetical protein HY024_01520 [Candidatus Curtissbacteria bacterium]|nr:hypothetical protein [Candidatus Curtissbacteria bacterium]